MNDLGFPVLEERYFFLTEGDPGSGPGQLNLHRSLTGLPGGNSKWVPPDPISNSEVKLLSADGSVGPPHVRVGHRQALK